MNDVYVASIIDVLKPKFLTKGDVRDFIGIIFDFYNKHGKLPNATEIRVYLTTEDLKASMKSIMAQFKIMDSTYNQDELMKNTEQFLRERAVYNAVKETVDLVHSTSMVDTHEIFKKFEDSCHISIVDNLGMDYFQSIDKHISEITVNEQFISTGFKWLDKSLGGGLLQNGRALYLIQGGVNVGKSIVLGNLAANVVMGGKKTVLISMEMSEHVYAKRMSCLFSGIPWRNLKSESLTLKQSLEASALKYDRSKLIIKEFPPHSITMNHVKAYLRKLEQKRGIQIEAVFIDYLTLIESAKPVGSMYQDNKDVAEQMRALSYPEFFGCPFFSACQSNRSAQQEEEPEMNTIAESMGLPQTADYIGSIWATDADKELDILNWKHTKSRFELNTGRQAFKINYDTLKMTEMETVFQDAGEVHDADNMLERLGKQ